PALAVCWKPRRPAAAALAFLTSPAGKDTCSVSSERRAVKIAVVGTGYVGLVTATCLAESGNDVIGIDKDQRKIQTLEAGRLPIHEPGLLELMLRNRRDHRLGFTTDLAAGVRDAEIVFLAVGTP